MAAGWLIAELFVVYPKAVWDFLNEKNDLILPFMKSVSILLFFRQTVIISFSE